MRRIDTLYPYICILMLSCMGILSSCNKDDVPEADVEVDIPFNGYIHFGADRFTTRASQGNALEDLTGQDFGVIAFQYTSDWNTFKATGTPASSQFPFPTKVYYKGSAWTYDKTNRDNPEPPILVEWDNDSKYTFFAYYPYSSSGSCVSTETSQSTAGVPSIKYTVPSWTTPSQLKDVMIASVKDAKNNSDGTVYFNFKHCLSCLTIEARNLDEVKPDHSSDQSIKNLTLTITSNLYGDLTIPLDYNLDPTPISQKTGSKTYTVCGSTAINVPPISTTEGDPNKGKIQVVSVSGDNNIFIIPQKANGPNGHLQGYVTFVDKNGATKTGKSGDAGYDANLEFNSDKDFVAGRKYSLIVNFANGMISVAIIESGDWEDVDITHTFE